MFEKTTLKDWENLVQKQLKTDDIYAVLQKENLEGISVKPYYGAGGDSLPVLPKIEESTQLVSYYDENLEGEVFAFLLDENVENLSEKLLLINNKDLAEHILVEENNRYISLIDPIEDSQHAGLDEQLTRELLAKNFERNICIDVSLHQNAGASIVQQLAFALAKAKELTERFGSEVLSKLSFRFAVGANYFFEIAKIRTFKLLFNEFSKEFCLDLWPYIFAETSKRNKSISDPENNLIRSTLEISAAMIGGADAVYSHDFRVENASSLSREISFKQQIVLAYESIVNVFEDAANGSYYVEEITRQFAEKAWKLFLDLEADGGFITAISAGKIQKMIYDQATEEQRWVAEGKIKLIGVNLYPAKEATKSIENLYDSSRIKAVRLAEMFE